MEVLDHVSLQHPIGVTLFKQAQPAAAVVALAEVLADALEAHTHASCHRTQHRSGERLKLAIRCIQIRDCHAFAGCQILEHAWRELTHALTFVNLITHQLALWRLDKAHQCAASTGTHQLGLLVTLQHV